MKYSGDMSLFLPGYDYINQYTKRLEKKLVSVCDSDDIEDVHQSRTSCRRLLAGLEFFRDFFDRKHYKQWHKKVANLLRAMGDVRDLDVQILYLENILSQLGDNESRYRPGLKDILIKRQERRQECQPGLIETIESVRKEGLLKDIRKELKKTLKDNESSFPGGVTESGIELLHMRIGEKVKKLRECEYCLASPEEKKAHHNMRIKSKQLRYTLELSDVVMGGILDCFVQKVKAIQAMLGEIHDYDVWEVILSDSLLQSDVRVGVDHRYAFLVAKLMPGQEFLLEEVKHNREIKFIRFKEFWSELEVERFWQSLEDVFGMLRAGDIELHYI